MRAVLALGGDRPGRALILREPKARTWCWAWTGRGLSDGDGSDSRPVVGDLDSLDEGTKAVLAAGACPLTLSGPQGRD
jgi:hypothetical protein